MEILNHSRCTGELNAPPGTEADVNALPVAVSDTDLGPAYFSFWKPDAADLALLNAGHPIELGVYSQLHPVVSLGVAKEMA